ncbi:MAG: AEC family transporter [Collinsella sp.]|nr:AEC family transporter [Collinsella sp.]
MNLVLIRVSSFIAIIVVGIIAGRSGKLGKKTGESISKIVFNITLPAAIIHAFGAADFAPWMLALVPLGITCALGPYLLTFAATKNLNHNDRVLYLLNSSGFNIGSFGLPFVQAFFPASTVVAACMFDAGNAFMMTGGTFALTRVLAGGETIEHPLRDVVKRLISSIPFDSYLILVSLALIGVRVPEPIVMFTEPMAQANGFLSMFMLGLMVCFSVNGEKLHKLLNLISIRVFFSTLMSASVFLLPFPLDVRLIIIILLWAPMGSMGPVFTLWAGGDHGLAGLANTVSIFLSLLAMTCITVASGAIV